MSEAEAARAVREDVDGMRDYVLRERPRTHPRRSGHVLPLQTDARIS